jgi:hypothetical protein
VSAKVPKKGGMPIFLHQAFILVKAYSLQRKLVEVCSLVQVRNPYLDCGPVRACDFYHTVDVVSIILVKSVALVSLPVGLNPTHTEILLAQCQIYHQHGVLHLTESFLPDKLKITILQCLEHLISPKAYFFFRINQITNTKITTVKPINIIITKVLENGC